MIRLQNQGSHLSFSQPSHHVSQRSPTVCSVCFQGYIEPASTIRAINCSAVILHLFSTNPSCYIQEHTMLLSASRFDTNRS
jgi:hypothetical protein